jgi:hypothetical protein
LGGILHRRDEGPEFLVSPPGIEVLVEEPEAGLLFQPALLGLISAQFFLFPSEASRLQHGHGDADQGHDDLVEA